MLKQSKKGGYYDIHKKNKDIPLFDYYGVRSPLNTEK